MRKELEYSLKILNDAFLKLKTGIEQTENELDRDGVIQRFEFTSELLWKTLRIFLKLEGINTRTPRQCLEQAFRIGIIKDEQIFLDMLEDRNRTSHIYNEAIAKKIFKNIKEHYISRIEQALNSMGTNEN